MKIILSIISVLIAGLLAAQQTVLSKIPKTAKTIMAFVPEGFDTIATASGDLNKDKLDDYVLVLKMKKEATFDYAKDNEDSLFRLLVVVFKNNDGYTLAGKCGEAIMCMGCGGVFGDPFASVTITKGIFIVDHYGGSAQRWAYTHKFRYQNNDFYLIGRSSRAYQSNHYCEKLDDFADLGYDDENLLTGDYVEKEISGECKLISNKKGKRKVKPLQKLGGFSIEQDIIDN